MLSIWCPAMFSMLGYRYIGTTAATTGYCLTASSGIISAAKEARETLSGMPDGADMIVAVAINLWSWGTSSL